MPVNLSLDLLVTQLKAAGDDTRVRLLALLARGERTVKELTDILGQSQPRVSRHLKVLTEAGLIARNPEGSWVYYRLAEADGGGLVRRLVDALDESGSRIRHDLARLDAQRQANRLAAERYFAEHADRWDEIRSLHVPEGQVEAAILAAAGEGPFRAMLDIGTGTGRMLELFAPRTERALGVDTSAAMLAVARANLERAGIRHARVRIGDGGNLPVLRDSFDLIVIHQVLHFLDDPRRMLIEAANALAFGGQLLIVDFAPHDLEFLRQDQAHRRLGFSHEQMQQWITEAGLESLRIENLPPSGQATGLTVTIWTARDHRASGAEPSMAEAGS